MDVNNLLDSFISEIKDKLNFGPSGLFGLDLGLSAVKISQVAQDKNGQFILTAYASISLPEASLIEDEIQKDDEIIDVISRTLDKSGIDSKNVSFGLFGPNTALRKLQLAGGDDEEIEDQVMWEVEQYIPFAVEESNISYHTMGENEGGGVDVIVAAAKKDVVLNYKDLVEKVGLKIKIMDLGILALVNAFLLTHEKEIEEDKSKSWILIDFGAQKSQLIIIKYGKIAFSKEINIGCVIITEEIQRQMGVNYIEAEDLKITGDGSGNIPEEILGIIDDVVEGFLSEIKKTVDFYITSTSDEDFIKCIITGGGIKIPGLKEGLEALIGIDVRKLNIFDIISYDDKEFTEDQIEEISCFGVTSIALAMREVES